jgi:hypothetical protein
MLKEPILTLYYWIECMISKYLSVGFNVMVHLHPGK